MTPPSLTKLFFVLEIGDKKVLSRQVSRTIFFAGDMLYILISFMEYAYIFVLLRSGECVNVDILKSWMASSHLKKFITL